MVVLCFPALSSTLRPPTARNRGRESRGEHDEEEAVMRLMRVLIGLVVGLTTIHVATTAQGAVLCRKKSGVVIWRQPTCKPKETALNLTELGVLGPTGPTGSAGVDGADGADGAPAVVQRTDLHYTGQDDAAPGGFPFAEFRSVGPFTKAQAGTTIKLTWNAHGRAIGAAGNFCHWQLRIDGNDSLGSASASPNVASEGTAVLYATAATSYDNLSATAHFDGLATGSHTVSL